MSYALFQFFFFPKLLLFFIYLSNFLIKLFAFKESIMMIFILWEFFLWIYFPPIHTECPFVFLTETEASFFFLNPFVRFNILNNAIFFVEINNRKFNILVWFFTNIFIDLMLKLCLNFLGGCFCFVLWFYKVK